LPVWQDRGKRVGHNFARPDGRQYSGIALPFG
jgi:hypothetical protein